MNNLNEKQQLAIKPSEQPIDASREEAVDQAVKGIGGLLRSMGLSPRWVTLVTTLLGVAATIYFTVIATGCQMPQELHVSGEQGQLMFSHELGGFVIQGQRGAPVQKGK